jgi:perosamine synthetase
VASGPIATFVGGFCNRGVELGLTIISRQNGIGLAQAWRSDFVHKYRGFLADASPAPRLDKQPKISPAAGVSGGCLLGGAKQSVGKMFTPHPSQCWMGQVTDDETLALHGGKKACPHPFHRPVRWGAPELQQLGETLKQPSLYYWKNKQTSLRIERYRAIYGHQYVQPCSSGSAALHMAVAAAGIAPGDEVITSGMTDIGTVIGVLFQQAVPVFADLEPHTACLDPADVERKITPRTKAVIAVHLCGNPRKLAELKAIADRHKLILIEDSAQAWGARYRGKPIGTVGQVTCFSLQDTKRITCGDGGVVATNDEKLGPWLTKFGDKGINRYFPEDSSNVLAANYRISELQAAFVAAQLTRLEGIAEKRSQLGMLLTQELAGVSGITTPEVQAEDRCIHWFTCCGSCRRK